MRKFFIPAAVIAVALSSSAVFASPGDGVGTEYQSMGNVLAWNADTHMLTLTDGSVFHVPTKYANEAFKAGDAIKVAFTVQASGSSINDVTDVTSTQ